MASKTLPELDPAGAVSDSDLVPSRQTGQTTDKKLTFALVKSWIKSWIVKADVGLSNVDNTSDSGKPVSTIQQTALNLKVNNSEVTSIITSAGNGTDNNQTGTTYVLVLSDANNVPIFMDNASPNTLTIPTNASVAIPIGTKIAVSRSGAGVTTIDGDTGVTVNGVSGGSVVINNQYQWAIMSKRDTDVWEIGGDIT